MLQKILHHFNFNHQSGRIVLYMLLCGWMVGTGAARVDAARQTASSRMAHSRFIGDRKGRPSSGELLKRGGQEEKFRCGTVLETVRGRQVDIDTIRGWRVIYFWSSVCPCVKACERYSLMPLAQKYSGRVNFFAIASNGYDLGFPRPELAYLIDQHRLPYPVLLDTGHVLARRCGAKVTPQAIVLSPGGDVVFSGMPDDSRRFIYNLNVLSGNRRVPDCYLSRALAEGLSGMPVTETPPKDEGCSIAW